MARIPEYSAVQLWEYAKEVRDEVEAIAALLSWIAEDLPPSDDDQKSMGTLRQQLDAAILRLDGLLSRKFAVPPSFREEEEGSGFDIPF